MRNSRPWKYASSDRGSGCRPNYHKEPLAELHYIARDAQNVKDVNF